MHVETYAYQPHNAPQSGVMLPMLAGALLAVLIAPTAYKEAQEHTSSTPGTLNDLILKYEAGAKGHNSYNRGSMRCAKSNRAPLNITGMTIAQIQHYQSMPVCSYNKLLAVGGHQIIPGTLNQAVRTLGIPKYTKFTPEVQGRIFAEFLADKKRPEIARYIRTGQNITAAANAVANEWAIFKTTSGRGAHDGNGNNKGRVAANKVMAALKKSHINYNAALNAGLNSDDAYAIALGVKSFNKESI